MGKTTGGVRKRSSGVWSQVEKIKDWVPRSRRVNGKTRRKKKILSTFNTVKVKIFEKM